MKTKKSAVPSRGYSAHSTQIVDDGIITQVENRFDFTTRMNKDDVAALKATVSAATPGERIRRRLVELDALKDSTPAIQLRVDAIRRIYGGLGGTGRMSREELDLLREADRHWKELLILRDVFPKAVHGAKFPGRKPGSYGPIKKLIRRILAKGPIKNRVLIRKLEDAGCDIYEDRKHFKSETYIEGPRGDSMPYKRLIDAASEVRLDLKKAVIKK